MCIRDRAYPILRELGMSAMFFVSTGHIDSGMPYEYDWLVHMVCTTTAPTMDIPELDVAWELPASLEGRRGIAARLLEHLKSFDAVTQEAAIEADPNNLQLVAEDEGVVVGTLQITFIRGLTRLGACLLYTSRCV